MAAYKSLVDIKISREVKRFFGSAPYPLDRGLVAIVGDTPRGVAVDLYVDAPGAFAMNALPEWPDIVNATLPAMVPELNRVVSTPGLSIWSEAPAREDVFIGTAGRGGAIAQDSASVFLKPADAMEYLGRMHEKGSIAPANMVHSLCAQADGFSTRYRFPNNANHGAEEKTWEWASIVFMANFVNSGGANAGRLIYGGSFADLVSIARPGYTMVCAQVDTMFSNGTVFQPTIPSWKGQPVIELVPTMVGTGTAWACLEFKSSYEASPFYIYNGNVGLASSPVYGMSNTRGTLALDGLRKMGLCFQEYSWSDVNFVNEPVMRTTGFESIAALFPTTPAFDTKYPTGSHIEGFSPLRAFPQFSQECGIDAMVMVAKPADVSAYEYAREDGINVKVIVVGSHDVYSAVPTSWIKAWAGRRVKDGKLDASKEAEVKAFCDTEGDIAITIVEYAVPVRLEQDLVSKTEMAISYKKAREKACKDDNFLSKEFVPGMTYGALQTKINGSLSTRVFFGYRDRNAAVQFNPIGASDMVATGSVTATKVNGVITTVVVAGSSDVMVGSFTSPDAIVGEALVAGYSVSGATIDEICAWLGAEGTTVAANRATAAPMIDEAKRSLDVSAKRSDAYNWQSYALSFGGFPDYKAVSSVNVDTGRRLAMTSKGAILCGPTVLNLLHESRL